MSDWRPAEPGDRDATGRFLAGHIDWAMFPLANLTHYGMGRDGRHQMRFWLWPGDGAPEAAVGLTGLGNFLPVLPGAGETQLAALRPALAGLDTVGVIGRSDWARSLIGALGLTRAAAAHLADDPAFALDLGRLAVPSDDGLRLAPLRREDVPLLRRWRAAYQSEVFGAGEDAAAQSAAADIETYLARDSHRLLWQGDRPVAMTGFNAVLPETVQIGGVYTPPDLRGRGHARAAVALHLAEARGTGVRRAILFAANAAAVRAYRAIGFAPTGTMTLCLLPRPVRLSA